MWDSYYYIAGEQGIIVLGMGLDAPERLEIEGTLMIYLHKMQVCHHQEL
jgi:hypothetical protein